MTLRFLVLLLLFTVTAAVRGNDDFAQRRVLPSTETVAVKIQRPAALSYEPFDPLTRSIYLSYGADRVGSLWYTWTAPRDGIFKAAAAGTDGNTMAAHVYEGDSLARLLRVQNGNGEGISLDNTTIFQAVAGRSYVI